MARTHLNDTILPDLVKKHLNAQTRNRPATALESLIIQCYNYQNNGPGRKVSESTAGRWMKRLGFRYQSHQKSFYVDGHERLDVVLHRKAFTEEYLTELEPRCYRWLQVKKSEVETWKKEEKIPSDDNRGYHYKSVDDEEYVEFHADDYEFLHDMAKDLGYRYGGNLSVRMPAGCKPLIIFGQDECAFAQYLMSSKGWGGPKGKRPLLPKNEGSFMMISLGLDWRFLKSS